MVDDVGNGGSSGGVCGFIRMKIHHVAGVNLNIFNLMVLHTQTHSHTHTRTHTQPHISSLHGADMQCEKCFVRYAKACVCDGDATQPADLTVSHSI